MIFAIPQPQFCFIQSNKVFAIIFFVHIFHFSFLFCFMFHPLFTFIFSMGIFMWWSWCNTTGSTTDATELSTWNIRFDVRMLATQWKWSAEIPWNSFVLTTKKSGLQANQHVTLLNRWIQPNTAAEHNFISLATTCKWIISIVSI